MNLKKIKIDNIDKVNKDKMKIVGITGLIASGKSTLSSYLKSHICSTRQSCSQALLCHCTLWLISIQPERTFERLRYSFGGDRPSQTAHLALSPWLQTTD